MRGFATAAALALTLSTGPVFAQAAAPQRPAAPAGQAGATPQKPAAPPASAQPRPAAPAPPPAPALPPSLPFPQGAKVGIVNLQALASASAEGRAATGKIQALIQRKQTEGAQKSKALQDNQAKLQQGGALMNDTARAALEKEIERQTVEGQRFEQDAQAEVTAFQNELQNEFQKKVFPVLQQLAKDRELHMLLSATEAGVIWAEPAIDLTVEAIKRLDATTAK